MTASVLLADAAALGPFFAVAVPAAGPERQLLGELDSAAGHALLADRIGRMGEMLGVDPAQQRRPLASMLHLGAAAACVGPVLACAALSGRVPELTPGTTAISYAGGRLELGLAGAVGVTAGRLPDLASAVGRISLDGLLAGFTAALDPVVALPATITAGNALSALAAAARLITPPAAGRRARAIVDLVARECLGGAGELHWQEEDPAAYFRRNSCCLFYKIPGAGYCGDCVLAPAA